MQTLTLNWHSDPGHAWLEVPKVIVRGLGPQVCNSISIFSYQDRENLYLEEDSDAPMVLTELKKHFQVVTKELDSVNVEHKIRNMKRVNC